MKPVTEFPVHKLSQGLQAKAALTEEGKTPEEIEQSLGEKFKYEGEKLKYFISAMEVASQNMEKLSRVLIVTLNEGENAPPKAVKIEEHHYIPDFIIGVRTSATKAVAKGGGQGKGGGRQGGGGGKESPWGLSPEQKAAKKGPAPKAAKAK